MNSLKSSVNSGKAQIASAITDKGVSTSASDSFSQMATNINQIKTDINGVPVYGTDFTYTGNYQIISEDDSGNWKIKFLTSGTFTAMNDVLIDIFAVGGAGAGGYGESGAGGGGSGVSGGTNCACSNIDGITNTGGGENHITQFSGGLTYTFPAAGKDGSGILVIRNAR